MKQIDGTMRFEPTRNAAFRRIGEEVVIVDTLTNKMMTLNETGSEIWKVIESQTIAQIAGHLNARFKVTQDVALNDTRIFIEELLKKGLIQEAKNPTEG